MAFLLVTFRLMCHPATPTHHCLWTTRAWRCMCMWGEYSKVGGVATSKAKCWPVAFVRKNSCKVVVFTAHLGCKCPSLVLLEEPSISKIYK